MGFVSELKAFYLMERKNIHNIIRDKYSKKHHYLPVFYLNGFADSGGSFYIYDKTKDIILPKQKPYSKFYENNLNNYKPGKEVLFTMEESHFTPLDTKVSLLFAKIRNLKYTDEALSNEDKWDALSFIMSLFWRSPATNALFVELIKKEGFTNRFFGIYRQDGQERKYILDKEVPQIINQILNDTDLQKIFKHIIPLSDGSHNEIFNLYKNWKLFDLENNHIITGDNPFVTNNEDIRLDNIFNELIFPIGSKKLLFLVNTSANFLDAITLMQVNLCILHQSKRFIASDSEAHIKQLLNQYNTLIQRTGTKDIVKETFDLLRYQSNFESHSEYSLALDKANPNF